MYSDSSHLTRRLARARVGSLAACACAIAALVAPSLASAAPTAPSGFTVSTFATAPTSPAAVGPDDLAQLGDHVFIGWQNGVGTMGEPSTNPITSGQTQSTIVEYALDGTPVNTWSVKGKADGMGADRANHRVIITVNEDGNSSLYTLTPHAPPGSQLQHYNYSPDPASGTGGGVLTGGGADAVTVDDGNIYIAASNPQMLSATATFLATLDATSGTANLAPTFADNASATNGATGAPVTLGLTDPDSNAWVPESAKRLRDRYLLDSQADQQLIFAKRLPGSSTKLTQLPLSRGSQSAGVDDVRFASSHTLLVIDNAVNVVYRVTGHFPAGQAYASLDTVGTSADTTEVDTLNLSSGQLAPFITGLTTSKGLLFVSNGEHEGHGGRAHSHGDRGHGHDHSHRHGSRH